jgi:hypothetical protein
VDLLDITSRTGLPIRRVRYVLEHRILPGTEKASRGHRVPRTFTSFESFGIALAAVLLEAGIRRPLVQRLIDQLLRQLPDAKGRARSALLSQLYHTAEASLLELADGDHFRVQIGIGPPSEWLPLRRQVSRPPAEPLAIVRVDAGRLRDALQQ